MHSIDMSVRGEAVCSLHGVVLRRVGVRIFLQLLLLAVLLVALETSAAQECDTVTSLAEINARLRQGSVSGRFCVQEGCADLISCQKDVM